MKKAIKILTFFIASIINLLLLLPFYYLIFTPYALVLRIFQRDLLVQKIDKNRSSYWQQILQRNKNEYLRQY